jgi:hypothetical protein
MKEPGTAPMRDTSHERNIVDVFMKHRTGEGSLLNSLFSEVLIDFAHKEHVLHKIAAQGVIPVKTGIQNLLSSEFLWTPAFAGETNQFK